MTLALAAIGTFSGTTALASLPKAGAAYSGSGGDYMNNAPTWAREATGKVSFMTSANRRQILKFKGSYSYYCGAGTSTITAAHIAVSRSGHFSYRFKAPNRLADGAVQGTDYVAIEGSFSGNGDRASVSYLVDFAEGTPPRSPYSTSDPHALGCASWVRATVHAR